MTVTQARPRTPRRLTGGLSAGAGRWRRLPRAAKGCALIAFLNCMVWAMLVPPWHVPDEVVHVAYAQYLAEEGRPPDHDPGRMWSTEEFRLVTALAWQSVIGNPSDNPVWSELEQRTYERAGDGHRRDDGGNKSVASNHPPLYYVPMALAYEATPGGLMTELYVMRVVSALMAAATVLCVFLFLREVLPRRRIAWTVGALAVAFQPMFAFEGGGVNNDNLFYLAAAAMFLALARALRRGLTVRRGVAIGLALGLGLVTKLTMVAFIPAVAAALAWLAWRDRAERRLAPLRAALAGGVAAVFPFLVYATLNAAVWQRPLLQADAGGSGRVELASTEPIVTAVVKPFDVREFLSYSWQLYLPKLPFQQDLFPGQTPLWDTWFTGLVSGRFGWLDYGFLPLFSRIALIFVVVPLLVLAGRALWVRRHALRGPRLGELAVYALAMAGLLGLIAHASYTTYIGPEPYPFEQPRYLLPLLPLYGLIVALAVRGAGRRAGPAVAAALVMIAFAHNLFAQALTITRYYA